MMSRMSLYDNLTMCLRTLGRLRELHKVPEGIEAHLSSLESYIVLCQCASVEDKTAEFADWETYAFVFRKLAEMAEANHTLLQLYFSNSLHWEHYHWNVTETVDKLAEILCHSEIAADDDDSRSVSGSGAEIDELCCVSECSADLCVCWRKPTNLRKFQRQFVPLKKIARSRRWSYSWLCKTL